MSVFCLFFQTAHLSKPSLHVSLFRLTTMKPRVLSLLRNWGSSNRQPRHDRQAKCQQKTADVFCSGAFSIGRFQRASLRQETALFCVSLLGLCQSVRWWRLPVCMPAFLGALLLFLQKRSSC